MTNASNLVDFVTALQTKYPLFDETEKPKLRMLTNSELKKLEIMQNTLLNFDKFLLKKELIFQSLICDEIKARHKIDKLVRP